MVPAPSDALFFEAEQLEQQTPEAQAWRKRLVPLQLPDGAQTDLTCTYPTLKHLVGLPRPDPRKPHKTPPRFWYWESFEEWLTRPAAEDEDLCTLAHIGHGGAQQESRTHVSIDPHKQSSRDEHLFQTRGLEFTHNRNRLALAIAVADETEPQDGGLSPLGGERRVVMWRKSTTPLHPLPTAILEAIQDSRACRIILLTPAHFEQGWKPAWLMEPREGVQPVLQAVAIQRPQVVSGWELAANHDNDNQNNSKKKAGGRPKPTRRLAPAGSVFFLKLEGEREPNAIEQWLRATWMHCISDDEQSRLDGFGLAVAGAWDRSFTMTR
jgi:CRISPR-associated protein Cmr3